MQAVASPRRNRLKEQLGLERVDVKDPVAAFNERPSVDTFIAIPKTRQTEDMVRRALDSDGPCTNPILKYISKRRINQEVCLKAVTKYGLNLRYVPEEYFCESMYMLAVMQDCHVLDPGYGAIPEDKITFEMCDVAVANGASLRCVPKRFLGTPRGKALCMVAFERDPLELRYIPAGYVTEAMAWDAVRRTRSGFYNDRQVFVAASTWPIEYVPRRYQTKELCDLSRGLFPRSISAIPEEFLSEKICLDYVRQDGMNLEYVPGGFRHSRKVINTALKLSPEAIRYVPDERQTRRMWHKAIDRNPDLYPYSHSRFGDDEKILDYQRKRQEKAWVERREAEAAAVEPSLLGVDVAPVSLSVPTRVEGGTALAVQGDRAMVHELADCDSDLADRVYYVTDIHLEHQLRLRGDDAGVRRKISDKLRELIDESTVRRQRRDHASGRLSRDLLLIGGDIAHSIELERIFYEELDTRWGGTTVAVLGNHELWDGDPFGVRRPRPVEEIASDYDGMMAENNALLLENALLLRYKGRTWRRIDESTLLEADVAELAELCRESTCLVLGGIGFSGRNPVYNAEMGLYRAAVQTLAEDRRRSERFRTVYEKVLASAEDMQVIVLTHTQMMDWSGDQYNPSWVYVSGHTHQNALIRRDDGTTVLYDNQIGYKPREWHLNSFTRRGTFDPLDILTDGIHKITREQYIEFNRGHGIAMQDFGYKGQLYALKRAGTYTFFLEGSSSLCMLEGGLRRKAEHSLGYYYENMGEYACRVDALFRPYRTALGKLAREVKAFGGQGTVHGCIVDIDYFNHIYLNPLDGKITPYHAFTMYERHVYDSVPALLDKNPLALKRYERALESGELRILAQQEHDKEMSLATVPRTITDLTGYDTSKTMRKIQYVLDQNVIRIWNDEVLTVDGITGGEQHKALN